MEMDQLVLLQLKVLVKDMEQPKPIVCLQLEELNVSGMLEHHQQHAKL
jgi:hypothetical protein